MDRRFLESLIHRPHVICGYKLRPYSLATAVALEAAGDPLTGIPTPSELIIFLKICSAENPFNVDFRATFRDYYLARKMRNHVKLADAMQAVRAYVDDFAPMPTLTTPMEGPEGDIQAVSKPVSAPWAASRAASLHQSTNLSDKEIWGLPLGYIMWLDAAGAEHRGAKITFFDPENPDLDENDIAYLQRLAKEPMPQVEENFPADSFDPAEVWGTAPKEPGKKITPKKNRPKRKNTRRNSNG
jgi:hypothetical protein